MRSKTVAILEARVGQHLGELIARRGAIPLLAPALAEVPDIDPQTVVALLDGWRLAPFRMVVFQTGVGTRALFQATDTLGATAEMLSLLADTLVVVRGPKPTKELHAREVRIDIRAPAPFTTETVLAAVAGVALDGARVLVQRYGASNPGLDAGLTARGARVSEIATYRWSLPPDIQPLTALLDALGTSQVDAVVFTSAVQIHHLYAVAARQGRAESLAARLQATIIASIGPVCSRALRDHGIEPTFEASPPKLGPLVEALEAALRAH